MAEEYRTTIYFGAGEEARKLHDAVTLHGTRMEFKKSKMEFLRHCVRFTLANDSMCKSKFKK